MRTPLLPLWLILLAFAPAPLFAQFDEGDPLDELFGEKLEGEEEVLPEDPLERSEVLLARGRHDLDCGCAGPGAPQPLHPRLLSRNLLLAGLALLAAAPAAPRALGVFDGFVVLAATAVTVLLYAAIEVWLANQPRLLGLSGR